MDDVCATLGADRFVQEIETTANLQHPHTLPLFDSAEAMVYEDGRNMRTVSAEGGQAASGVPDAIEPFGGAQTQLQPQE